MKKGDAITIVQEAQLVLIECLFAGGPDYFLAGAYKLLLADEGITWLKGYHTPDEECVNAARTCQALREQEQPGVTGPTGPTGYPGPVGVTGPGGGIFPNTPPLPQVVYPPWGSPAPNTWGGPLPNDHTVIVSSTDTKGLL